MNGRIERDFFFFSFPPFLHVMPFVCWRGACGPPPLLYLLIGSAAGGFNIEMQPPLEHLSLSNQ